MARKRNSGNGQLDESLQAMQHALAQMLQVQTEQLQQQTAILARISETDKEIAALRRRSNQIEAEIAETNRLNAERFARIEERLDRIEAILAELPERVHRRFA